MAAACRASRPACGRGTVRAWRHRSGSGVRAVSLGANDGRRAAAGRTKTNGPPVRRDAFRAWRHRSRGVAWRVPCRWARTAGGARPPGAPRASRPACRVSRLATPFGWRGAWRARAAPPARCGAEAGFAPGDTVRVAWRVPCRWVRTTGGAWRARAAPPARCGAEARFAPGDTVRGAWHEPCRWARTNGGARPPGAQKRTALPKEGRSPLVSTQVFEHLLRGASAACPRGDLNPYALIRALAPQASASTNSATRTGCDAEQLVLASGRSTGFPRRSCREKTLARV